MAASDFNIALRNYSGVPVVELAGEINKKTLAMLNDTLIKLAQAGHYNVVLNLKNAAWKNLTALTSLETIAKVFKTHYGNLDVIVDTSQIVELLKLRSLGRLFRFFTSEVQALTCIKRLPVPSFEGVSAMPAHLVES